MSGGGRKHRAKRLVQACDELHEPEEGELVVQVLDTRGASVYEVLHPDGTATLARLPKKFTKVVWVKKGDFCILERIHGDAPGPESTNGGVKVRSLIKYRLFPENVKHLKREGLWPAAFEAPETDARVDAPVTHTEAMDEAQLLPPAEAADADGEEEEEEAEAEGDAWGEWGGNPNRRAAAEESDGDDDTEGEGDAAEGGPAAAAAKR
eukprot:EG_transcript_27075